MYPGRNEAKFYIKRGVIQYMGILPLCSSKEFSWEFEPVFIPQDSSGDLHYFYHVFLNSNNRGIIKYYLNNLHLSY